MGLLCTRGWESRSKLGRTHGIRMQLMTQLQAQVPHPLAGELPCLLTARSMTTPTIWVLLVVFICQSIFKCAAMQIQRHDIGSGERALGEIRQEQFIDDARASDADPTLGGPGLMRCHDNPPPHALRPQ